MITTKETETLYCGGKYKAIEAPGFMRQLYGLSMKLIEVTDRYESGVESVSASEKKELEAAGFKTVKMGTVYKWVK